jgi:acetyl esterase/lipase
MKARSILFLCGCVAYGLGPVLSVCAGQSAISVDRLDTPPGSLLHDLEYARAGDKSLRLDLYLPEHSGRPLPLIIWIHGGAWRAGQKANCHARLMLPHGYAVASIDYRLSQEALFPAQIEDCKAAVRWLRAHAKQHGLDPDRFAAWGDSAGGHLSALLGTTADIGDFDKGADLDVSSRVQAVCDYYGPTDFLKMDDHLPPRIARNHDMPGSPESLLIGGPIQKNKDKAARANPITYVTPKAAPFLIVHGDDDGSVPFNQSELLYEALKAAGVSVHLHVMKGADHGPPFAQPDVLDMVVKFFDHYLKGVENGVSTKALITYSSPAKSGE